MTGGIVAGHSLQQMSERLAAAGKAPLGLCHACCVEYKQALAGRNGDTRTALPLVSAAITMVVKAEQQRVPGMPQAVMAMVPLPICDRHMVLMNNSSLLTG